MIGIRDWCPRPLPPDETILEPIEECDESTLQLRIISPEPVELNDLGFNGDSICAGTEITINWTGGDQTWNVLVYVIDVSTWAVAAVVNSSTINDGDETWNIPSNFPAGNYQVYVQEVNYATWVYGDVFTVKYCPADPVCLEECDHNLLRNWNFNENPIFGPMPLGSVSDWTRWPNSKSPDVSRIKCSSNDTVSIGMWGNGINGESIFQTLTTPFQPGQTYSISFMAMWRDIPGRPYPVQFEFRANNANLSSGFELGESYPNPFSQTTVIEYTLPHTEKVTIKVFDLYGREIKTLVDKAVHPGTHQIEWDASGLPTGTYFRMQAGRFSQTGKTTLHK